MKDEGDTSAQSCIYVIGKELNLLLCRQRVNEENTRILIFGKEQNKYFLFPLNDVVLCLIVKLPLELLYKKRCYL